MIGEEKPLFCFVLFWFRKKAGYEVHQNIRNEPIWKVRNRTRGGGEEKNKTKFSFSLCGFWTSDENVDVLSDELSYFRVLNSTLSTQDDKQYQTFKQNKKKQPPDVNRKAKGIQRINSKAFATLIFNTYIVRRKIKQMQTYHSDSNLDFYLFFYF